MGWMASLRSLDTWVSLFVIIGVLVIGWQTFELRKTNQLTRASLEETQRQATLNMRPVVLTRPGGAPRFRSPETSLPGRGRVRR